MRLKSFQIQNYRSIIDSGIVELSDNDNIMVLAGQNESGKSAVLKALNSFETGNFELDSIRFFEGKPLAQSVSCAYKVERDDIIKIIVREFARKVMRDSKFSYQLRLIISKLREIRGFTIKVINESSELKTKNQDNKPRFEIDEDSFELFKYACYLTKNGSMERVEITDKHNPILAQICWEHTPLTLFFDSFCDLLPNRILISALKKEQKDTEGYRAVRNIEKVLGVDFVAMYDLSDADRSVKQEKDSELLSTNFQDSWGQKVYGNNKVNIKYEFEKRGPGSSYINFYVETQEHQRLAPRQRSRGLVWFFSLWLELEARDRLHRNLILLLDEPDQHLHIKAQEDMLKLIDRLAKGTDRNQRIKSRKYKIPVNGKQIIYATHSPYLIRTDALSRIKLVINDKRKGTQLEDITKSKIDTENKEDALQPFLQAIGWSAGASSPLHKQNVILEGMSDYLYFTAMRRVLGRNENYAFIPGIGIGHINPLISMCIGYGLAWVVIIDDDDPKKEKKPSKKKFDEISDYVFGGNETEAQKKIYILKDTPGIEKMFTDEDFYLIDPDIKRNSNGVNIVGKKRKIIVAKQFFEKVENDETIKKKLSDEARARFNKAFDFIDEAFGIKK